MRQCCPACWTAAKRGWFTSSQMHQIESQCRCHRDSLPPPPPPQGALLLFTVRCWGNTLSLQSRSTVTASDVMARQHIGVSHMTVRQRNKTEWRKREGCNWSVSGSGCWLNLGWNLFYAVCFYPDGGRDASRDWGRISITVKSLHVWVFERTKNKIKKIPKANPSTKCYQFIKKKKN